MLKSWITYGFWLIAVLLLNVFSPSNGSFIFLCLSAILPLSAIVLNTLIKQDLKIMVKLPDTAEKESITTGKIIITNTRRTILSFCKLVITSENLLTGEQNDFILKLSLTPKGKKELIIKLSDHYCGKIIFMVNDLLCYDIFGLTYKKGSADILGSIHILPEILDCNTNVLRLSESYVENKESLIDRPGFDLSEPYEYREYSVGDTPKSIHWKLSQKLDRLIVRQGGMPSPESLVLKLDTNIAVDRCYDFSMLSRTVEIFISISKNLCDRKISHMICFFDHITNEFFKFIIVSENDWYSVVPKILSVCFKECDKDCTEHYYEDLASNPDNIICVSPFSETNADSNMLVLTPQDFLPNK